MALFAALLCVSSYISIPLPFSPVVLTLQTLVVNLIALILPPKKAVLTVVVWVLLGTAGLPVFSGGVGGPAKLFGPTGGYIVGFVAAVWLISLLKGTQIKFWRWLLVTVCIGISVIYVVGVPWMMAVTGIGFGAAVTTSVLPFLPGDVLKCVAAAVIASQLLPALRMEGA